MNGFDAQRQASLRRKWQERPLNSMSIDPHCPPPHPPSSFYTKLLTAPHAYPNNLHNFPGLMNEDDLLSNVVPSVTVVLEGRSICQRINLHQHASYQSLARALRQMFVEEGSDASSANEGELDLSNAIPGYLVAYEDVENDLLLAGDLQWKDFVRVAKRIRIMPVKSNHNKGNKSSIQPQAHPSRLE
ncbi:hypothetical protein Ancab_027769 [Ancistrocladus abbreviatus]